MHQNVYQLLGPEGPFVRDIPDFSPREQQQEMASEIEACLENESVLIAEAGTGTGKTFAYLVPALMSGKKVIISTGTKNLQDQLYHRDLPSVRDVLGIPVTTALLKGRANYLCHHRLDIREKEGDMAPALMDQLATVRRWSGQTKSGDIAELDDITEDSVIWPMVTSTADNCLGTDCPSVADCCVLKARRKAQEADIVVVNHHLFFADMSLRDEGFGEVLPGANAFIFDEAHKMADIATQYFGTGLSSRQLIELARDAKAEVMQEAPDLTVTLTPIADALDKAVKDCRLSLGETGQRAQWSVIADNPKIQDALDEVELQLQALLDCLEPVMERAASLEKCVDRAQDLMMRLEIFIHDADNGDDFESTEQHEGSTQDDTEILWFETHARSFLFRKTPTSIANTFSHYMSSLRCGWVFTSATLTVAKSFKHFMRDMGIENAETQYWESPFDFQSQAVLYLPENLPEPNQRNFTDEVIDAAIPVINACRGRTFVLLTSYRALQRVAERLEDEIDFPLLVQGSMPRPELLDRFRRLGNAVLVGTSSFWEGVDVRGDALSCVIIDKLPFAYPDEPILQARLELMRKRGENPFFDYQIPQAVISLKQGVGRLIRGTEDRGVLMLCDTRLASKAYGRLFLNSLPAMPRTRQWPQVEAFCHSL